MDLRLDHYYRVNYVPVFITERTPGSSREDLWELLDSVGLDYYDRLEWLIRTDLRAAIDNLIVERAREEAVSKKVENARDLKACIESGQYGDEIIIENISSLGTDSRSCVKMLNRLMHYGIRLKSKQEKISSRNLSSISFRFLPLYFPFSFAKAIPFFCCRFLSC